MSLTKAPRQVPALDAPYSGAARKSPGWHRMCRIKSLVARSTAHPMQNQKRSAHPRNEAHHSRRMPWWLKLMTLPWRHACCMPFRYSAALSSSFFDLLFGHCLSVMGAPIVSNQWGYMGLRLAAPRGREVAGCRPEWAVNVRRGRMKKASAMFDMEPFVVSLWSERVRSLSRCSHEVVTRCPTIRASAVSRPASRPG